MTLIEILMSAGVAAAQEPDQSKRVEKLVQDLGAEDFKTREEAEQELRKIGVPAATALKKALEDKDAERADRARRILEDIGKKDEKPEGRKAVGVRISSRDLSRGITFDLYPDGKVELTVPKEDKDSGKKVYKTYKADSMDEFKEKYPEVAKQYDIDSFVPKVRIGSMGPGDLDEIMKRLRERLGQDQFGDLDEWFKDFGEPDQDIEKWMERQRKIFEEMRKRFQGGMPPGIPGKPEAHESGGRELGLKIEPVSEALAAQLELKEGEGVQVTEVKEGSLAEKAGLKKHDVILKLNGKTIADRWEFRRDVRGLVGQEFELEIFRGGKRETVKVSKE
jgi:hypothetical protein